VSCNGGEPAVQNGIARRLTDVIQVTIMNVNMTRNRGEQSHKCIPPDGIRGMALQRSRHVYHQSRNITIRNASSARVKA